MSFLQMQLEELGEQEALGRNGQLESQATNTPLSALRGGESEWGQHRKERKKELFLLKITIPDQMTKNDQRP